MTDYSSVIPHAAPGAEEPAVSTGKVRSLLKRMLRNGLDMPVRFLQSLRVGSGTGLSGMDGQNGAIIANGSAAKLVMGDTAAPNSNQWASWSFTDPTLVLSDWRGTFPFNINVQNSSVQLANSLRVGTGTGRGALDGVNGRIIAAGAAAGLYLVDANDPNNATANYAILQQLGASLQVAPNATTRWLISNTGANQINQSLRVGTAIGLAGLDTMDGAVILNGAGSGYYFGDRAAPASVVYGVWYRTGTTIQLFSSDGSALMSVVSTNGAATLKSSVRAGSGTGLASFDGTDGRVIASGPGGTLMFGDVAAPSASTFGQLFRTGTTITLYSSEGAGLVNFNTVNAAVAGRTSIKAGSTTTTGQDGTDGAVIADGPAAAVWFKDRAAADFAGWYMSGGFVNLYHGGDRWLINSNTGIITQDNLTAINPGSNTIFGGGWSPSGTRRMKPDGSVYLICSIQLAAAIGAGSAIGFVAAAHAPSAGFVPLLFRTGTGTPVTGYLRTDGTIICDAAQGISTVLSTMAVYY